MESSSVLQAATVTHEDMSGHTSSLCLFSDVKELREKNTFIDVPPSPMADRPRTPLASAPGALLSRLRARKAPSPAVPEREPCVEEEAEVPRQMAAKCPCGNTFFPDAVFCRKCGLLRATVEADPSVPSDTDVPEDCASSLVESLDDSVEQESGQVLSLQMPSVGSADHAIGTCTPCAWFWKIDGCRSGSSCTRCHLCPQGEIKMRKKAKEARMKQEQRQVQQERGGAASAGNSTAIASVERKDPLYVELGTLSELPSSPANSQQVTVDSPPIKVTVKNTFLEVKAQAAEEVPSAPHTYTWSPGDLINRMQNKFRSVAAASAAPPAQEEQADDTEAERATAPTPSSDTATTEAEVEEAKPLGGPAAHAAGTCTPCAYFWYKKDGCRMGLECQFCHVCEKGEVKKRKKQRINQLKETGAYIPGYAKLQSQR